jgi:RHS repeat-associated protein
VAPFDSAPPPHEGAAGTFSRVVSGIVGAIGAPAKIIDTAIAEFTAPIAAMFPAMPAVTLMGMHLGPPHGHTHPPSFIAPAPPVPLPSMGMLVGAGAVTVLIGGVPAARAGDIGISVTCGSLAPPFEVYTGSSNVFIGGARAARMADLTKHCNPTSTSAFDVAMGAAGAVAGAAGALEKSNPWAALQAAADAATLALKMLLGKDPGIPPGMGMLIGPPVPNVLIGGFPCPPLGQMAVGGLLKALKALGRSLKGGSAESNASCGNAGEPVYVVTGENFTKAVDFVSSLFEWRRHYTTARSREDGPLGHGWRHFFQRSLVVRLHRATFTDWNGLRVEFPCFEYGSNTVRAEGRVLRRLAPGLYRLSHRGQPDAEFSGNEFEGELRLSKLETDEHEVTLEYDAHARLSVAVERDSKSGARKRFALHYDEGGHVTHLVEVPPIDRAGIAAEPIVRSFHAYTAASELELTHDALGGRWAYEYDAFHRLKKSTDARGYVYTYRYDALGRCVETAGQDGLWTTQIAYFPEQKLGRVTESDGGTWEIFYDADGVVTKIVDPYGGAKLRERDGEGRLAREIDSGGRVVRWLYDDDGAHYARVDRFGNLLPPEAQGPASPNPFAKKLPATARGRLFEDAPKTARPTFGADPAFLSAIPSELEAQARLCFRLRAQPSAAPVAVREVARDALGRKVREVDATGYVREWGYDATGNLASVRDRDGRTSTQATVSWNLVGERRDPLGHAVRYRHSRLEQVIGVVDPLGNESSYDYDLKQRLVRVHRDGRLRDQYVYDVGDHFIEKRDGAGNALFKNEIHENHFVKVRHLASGGAHKLDYDAAGRITEASTADHEVRLGHDVWGRRLRDTRDDLGVVHEYVHGELDDSVDTTVLEKFLMTARRAPGATKLVGPSGKETRLAFRDDGIVTRYCSNGTTEVLQYDDGGRLCGRLVYRADPVGGLTRWATAYAYTPEGDLVQRDDSREGRTRFEIDDAHRLVAEETPGGDRHEFWQDAASNVRLSWVDIGKGNRLIASADERFTYDDRDRLVERQRADGVIRRYAYDSFDMLVRVETLPSQGGAASLWEAVYDAIGRRVEARWNDGKRVFHWDGDRLAAEVPPNGRLRIYEYATRHALVPLAFVEFPGPDAEPSGGAAFQVFSDPSGMPLRIEDESGKQVWSAARVHPFGSLAVGRGAALEYNLRWPGHYYDPETGLHYNRYRYYDPRLARYVQSDPLGYKGSPVNLYAYCANPLVRVDVLGLHDDLAKKSTDEESSEPDGKEGPPALSREELAAEEGATDAHIAARKGVAQDFYATKGKLYDPAIGANRPFQLPDEQPKIDAQLSGIDFTKPVRAGPPPPLPETLTQYHVPGRKGQFFAPEGTSASQVGLGAEGTDPSTGAVVDKTNDTYLMQNSDGESSDYLQSTAGPKDDVWSVADKVQPSTGGGTQYYVPNQGMTTNLTGSP